MSRWLAPLLLLAALLGGAADAATIFTTITSPPVGVPTFGRVAIAAEVVASEPIDRVEFYVDDRLVARKRHAPYRVEVDVGDENRERHFTVVAVSMSGDRKSDSRVTPAVHIDEAMDIALQQLYVTVTRAGERVLDLTRDDFRVVDRQERQELVTFERGDVPFTAVLLLDASESMRGTRLQAALDGARTFLGRLKPLDEAAAILFSDRVLSASPFSNQNADFLARLEGTIASGGTALNDHLYSAFRLLDERQGRRVVILLSDGADVVSALRMEEVLWKIRRSSALIYWIRLEGDQSLEVSFSSAWRSLEENRKESELLARAVVESGGRIASLRRPEEIGAAFDGILAELREQYVLGYYPSGRRHDGSWRAVKVRVRGDYEVRTREGYVDY